ncbi:PREDICTED: basic proline-rich protein-like, partial [Condylura cristata]|uniref:basic proline-rich protein-like n=1 Tax=Condylura cristata TaxID=143302 RepID=UPI000643C10B
MDGTGPVRRLGGRTAADTSRPGSPATHGPPSSVPAGRELGPQHGDVLGEEKTGGTGDSCRDDQSPGALGGRRTRVDAAASQPDSVDPQDRPGPLRGPLPADSAEPWTPGAWHPPRGDRKDGWCPAGRPARATPVSACPSGPGSASAPGPRPRTAGQCWKAPCALPDDPRPAQSDRHVLDGPRPVPDTGERAQVVDVRDGRLGPPTAALCVPCGVQGAERITGVPRAAVPVGSEDPSPETPGAPRPPAVPWVGPGRAGAEPSQCPGRPESSQQGR